MQPSGRLLSRVAAVAAGAVALTAVVAGPAYADRLRHDDDGAARTSFDDPEDADNRDDFGDRGDSDDRADADDREAREDAAEEAAEDRADAREAAAERADERDARRGRGGDDRDGRSRTQTHRTGSPDRTDAAAGPRSPSGQRKPRKQEGVYGIDKDPGTLAQDNLGGRPHPPGVYYPGLGTVEAPGIATN